MNIWLSFDEVENKNVDVIRNKLKDLQELTGKDYSFYFKVVPNSAGTVTFLICEELGIEADVTNYNNW